MTSDILVRAVLSGEAVYKTAALGTGNLFFLELDKNKYYLITKIVIHPFCNVLEDNDVFGIDTALFESASVTGGGGTLGGWMNRAWAQLNFYSSDFQFKWLYRPKYGVGTGLDHRGGGIDIPYTAPNIEWPVMEIECLIGTSASPYFYFTFPNLTDPGTGFFAANFATLGGFFNERNFVPVPFGGPNRASITVQQLQTNLAGGYNYSTVGLPNDNLATPFNTGSINLPIDNFNPGGFTSEVVQRYAGGAQGVEGVDLINWPTIQVHYYEFNRKPTFQGISGQNQLFSQG
jgi:hypothetical protein